MAESKMGTNMFMLSQTNKKTGVEGTNVIKAFM